MRAHDLLSMRNTMNGSSGASAGLSNTLRALRHRNYRLFFMGQGLSLIGTWMQRVALSWLVYRLTDSAWLLGLVGFAGQLPSFFMAPFAGVWADGGRSRRLLLITQILSMAQALTLAVLVLGGWIQVWHVVVLSLLLGAINGVDMPVRQSFLVEMIDERQDLGNAIALNSTMFNGARLIGPALAGVVIALAGEGVCFLVNGLSYVAVLASYLAMRLRPAGKQAGGKGGMWAELGEGWTYVRSSPPVWAILLLLMTFNFVAMPYTVLLPIFARDLLKGGPDTLGFLMGGAGVGAIAGALYLAGRRSVAGLGRLIVLAALVFCVALAAFAQSRLLWLSLLLLVPVGFGQMLQMAGSNTLLQSLVEDRMRGRVMSFYTMSFMGTFPLGSLLMGWSAEKVGAAWTLALGAFAYLICALLALPRMPELRRQAHAIYARKGLLSPRGGA